MGVLNIRLAQREGARLVISFGGISGTGKTFTALQLAFGMANFDASKVGFLDTENRRGSLYADALKHPVTGEIQQFYIGDLDAPFSPQRYIDAILEFQAAGVEILVVDSVSHEWEGSGGCEEIAAANPKMADWKKAKAEHKRFMNALLQSNMHIICCVRAREKVSMEKIEGRTVVTPLGIQPITEKNFMFEMTASVMMWNEGKAQQVMKCPADLQPMLGRLDGYITAADGQAIRQWVDGAKQLNPEVEKARNTLRTTTEQGMAALVAEWKKTPKAIREAISRDGKCPDDLKRSAEAFDAQRAEAKPGGIALDDLNNQVMGDPAQDAA